MKAIIDRDENPCFSLIIEPAYLAQYPTLVTEISDAFLMKYTRVMREYTALQNELELLSNA